MEKRKDLVATIKIGESSTTVIGTGMGTWTDLAVLLEGVGLLISRVEEEGNNPKKLKTRTEIITYCQNYLTQAGNDYRQSWSGQSEKEFKVKEIESYLK